jgi:hypothetical protein
MGGGMVLAQEGTTSSFGKRFREVYSTVLLLFCSVLIMAAVRLLLLLEISQILIHNSNTECLCLVFW